jgi:hypothetical protein
MLTQIAGENIISLYLHNNGQKAHITMHYRPTVLPPKTACPARREAVYRFRDFPAIALAKAGGFVACPAHQAGLLFFLSRQYDEIRKKK